MWGTTGVLERFVRPRAAMLDWRRAFLGGVRPISAAQGNFSCLLPRSRSRRRRRLKLQVAACCLRCRPTDFSMPLARWTTTTKSAAGRSAADGQAGTSLTGIRTCSGGICCRPCCESPSNMAGGGETEDHAVTWGVFWCGYGQGIKVAPNVDWPRGLRLPTTQKDKCGREGERVVARHAH